MRTIISVHVPKTAGKSFLGFLWESVEGRIYEDWPDGPGIEGAAFPARSLLRPLRGIRDRRRARSRRYVGVHGHFRASKYADLDGPMVAWVRDPVERIVSHFEYFKREPDPANRHAHAIQGGQSLLDFAAHPGLRDLQSRYLDVSLDRFTFVGRTESFSDDLPRAAAALGLPFGGIPLANTNPDRAGDRYELDHGVRAEILEMHGRDAELYERVTERFG